MKKLFYLFVLIFIPTFCFAQPFKVFILHSYELEHICGAPQEQGARSVLINSNIEIKTWAMDTKRKYNTSTLIKQRAEEAIKLINEYNPDVLYTLDDNAFNHVGKKYIDHPKLKIVFSGMNAQPPNHRGVIESWEKPGHNVTGVYEKLHVSTAFRIINEIVGTKVVAVLTDYSPTGEAITEQVLEELKENPVENVLWYITQVRTFEDYKKWMEKLNTTVIPTALYPVALLLKDKEGKTYTAPEILKWTSENSKIPTLTANYAFIRFGMFGGAGVDFYAMGKQAGNQILRIFNGEDPANISIEKAERYALIFNLTAAKKLGIEIPEDILLAADEVIK